ncbi:unnamed protein product [Effrenium voratum]|nr:unnamed protein product [Effrenium voratum]
MFWLLYVESLVYKITDGNDAAVTPATDRNSATTGAAVIYEGKVYTVSNEGGSHQTAVEGQGLLSMYDYETGALLWKVKLGLPGMQAAAAGQIAGVPGPSLVIGIGKNPGAPLLVRASMVLPHILTLLLGLPAHLLSLYFPHLFAWKQERSIAAFNAQTGALKWWYRLEPWQQLSCAGDSEKFLDRYKAMESGENPTNEPMCMPDANAQPVIDAAGTAFVPFQDGSIYAVRDENGDGQISPEEIKARRVGDAFQSSPAMGPGMMAVVDCGGRLEVLASPRRSMNIRFICPECGAEEDCRRANIAANLSAAYSAKFTPIESSIGGFLVGLSAFTAYAVDGKITGISGIMGPFLRGVAKCEPLKDGQLWKALFLSGLVLGGLVVWAFNKDFSFPAAPAYPFWRWILAGVLVGVGTRIGKGCTSGHGICGMPRFSLRSWIAVPVFMAAAASVVAITRHGLQEETNNLLYQQQVAELMWPPRWEFPVGALVTSLALLALATLLPHKIRRFLSPLFSGLIFAMGLGASGMTSQMKVINFLDFAGYWDPSLAFVMGLGICASFPAFFLADRPGKEGAARTPLAENCTFERPPRFGNYWPLIGGAVCFGVGWGLLGLCPGPALVGFLPYALMAGIDDHVPNVGFAGATLCIPIAWLATDKIIAYMGQSTVVKVDTPKDPQKATPEPVKASDGAQATA